MCRLITILFILCFSLNICACPLLKKVANKKNLNHRTLTLVIKKCTLTGDDLKAQKEEYVKAYNKVEVSTRNYCFDNIDQHHCMDDREDALNVLNKLVLKAQQLHWASLDATATTTKTKATTLDDDIKEADALIKEADAISKSIDDALEGAL